MFRGSRGIWFLRGLLAFAGLLPWVLAWAGMRSPGLDMIFRGLCHQDPSRSLVCHDTIMLVCSRCAGIYGGIALAACLPVFDGVRRHGTLIVLLASTLMALDVFTQDLGLHAPLHITRLGTGLLVGWSAAAYTLSLIRGTRVAAEQL